MKPFNLVQLFLTFLLHIQVISAWMFHRTV